MVKLILLRGPSGVGKSAIAKELLLHIKKVMHQDCAYIAEDNFRKKMQFKYKAEDKKAHVQSVSLITMAIKELNKIDSYEFIVIEGLFRYKEMLEKYRLFCSSKKINLFVFQLTAPLEVRKERNKISAVRDHIADLESLHGKGNGEEVPLKDSIMIDTTRPIEESVQKIMQSC